MCFFEISQVSGINRIIVNAIVIILCTYTSISCILFILSKVTKNSLYLQIFIKENRSKVVPFVIGNVVSCLVRSMTVVNETVITHHSSNKSQNISLVLNFLGFCLRVACSASSFGGFV